MDHKQIKRLLHLVSNFDEAIKSLSSEEQQEYKDAQQSVIDARRAGERLAHKLWVI